MVSIQNAFPLLSLGKYLLLLTTFDRYQSRDGNGNFFITTTSRNMSIVKNGVPLVTKLPLDFILILWIQWNQWISFRKNSVIEIHTEGTSRLKWKSMNIQFQPNFFLPFYDSTPILMGISVKKSISWNIVFRQTYTLAIKDGVKCTTKLIFFWDFS